MRDLIVGTLLLSSGVWFSLGFAYADFGMLKVSIALAVLNAMFLVGEFTIKIIKKNRITKFK